MPDDVELKSVNDSGVKLALFMAKTTGDVADGADSNAEWDVVKAYQDDDTDEQGKYHKGYFTLASDRNFLTEAEDYVEAEEEDYTIESANGVYTTYDESNNVIDLVLKHSDSEGNSEVGYNYYAKTFTTRLTVYAPKVEIDEDAGPREDFSKQGERIRVNVGVGRSWHVTDNQSATISKLGSRTLIALDGAGTDFEGDTYKEIAHLAKVVTGYDIIVDSGNVTVYGGSLGKIDANGEGNKVNVENANIGGNIEAAGGITVGEGTTVNGTLKGLSADAEVELRDGAIVDAIDDGDAVVTMDGASVRGNITANEFTAIDNEDYDNVVTGNVKVNDLTAEALDGSFTVNGSVIAGDEEATFNFEGNNIAINSIDGDYRAMTVNFTEADLNVSVTNTNSFNTAFVLESESDVTVDGSARIGSVEVEEDSVLRFASDVIVEDMNGDGMVVAPAGQLHINGSLADVQLRLTGLANGVTAFTATEDAVDPSDVNGVGFTVSKQSTSGNVDTFVVDSISFAGLAFDKEFATIAQGYSDTITLAAYPTGTTAPADARVMWELDGNDDYFNVVVDPNTNVATINVTGYNADDKTANTATIRAYLVDEDGYELEGYVAATCKVTAVAQPEIRGTLKADTTSYTLPVGGIYDIQFSVTGVDATPVVTDSRTGSVFQLTNLGGNKYRVTGVNEGTAYVVATVGDSRVSVAITVDNDATQGGEKGNNVSEIR